MLGVGYLSKIAFIHIDMDNQSKNESEKKEFQDHSKLKFSSEEFKKIWEKTHLSEGDFEPDLESAWNNLMKKAQEKQTTTFGYWKVAAAISLLVVCSWIIWNYTQSIQIDMKLVAATDSVKLVTLFDGSQVWLNASSSISYADNFLENREIKLNGEAFFQVAKMNGKPFTVLTESSKVTVLGTSFNVKEEATGEVKVQVATGKVAVVPLKQPENQILLEPGEETQVPVEIKSQSITKKKIHDQNYRSWQNQVLTFTNVPLTKIISKLSEHYHREILIDESLASCRYTTTFDHQSLEEVLEILRLTGDLEIIHSKNQIKIEGTPCK